MTIERAFGGKDYLDMWASDNGQEVLEQERLESKAAEKAAEKSKSTKPTQ